MAIKVNGELTPASVAGILGDAKTIIDRKHGNKMQEEINDIVSDKVYEAGSGKGLGRKNLPLNSIGNKNLLSQSMINQANTVYVIQNDYEIGSDGSVDLRVDPISVTIGGVNYYCKEVSLNAGETILLTTTGSAKIIINDGGSWVLYQYNYYTAQSNTTIRLGAVPTSQVSTINYIKTGGSITIPANCTLKFDGGSISGGTIVFNGTKLENPKFVDCLYNGNVQVDFLDDRNFTSTDDGNCLKWLLEQCLLLGIKLDINRNYTFTMPQGGLAIIPVEVTVTGAVIDFHNHTITDDWTGTTEGDIRGLISIRGRVSGLSISNVRLYDLNNNTHLHNKSLGMCGLITKGECSDITLANISMKYGDGVYRHGGYLPNQNLVVNGVVNSKFSGIKTEDASYTLAIYRGCNLDIEVEANHPHRGLYLAAVDNAKVRYRGYHPEETHCHILVQEGVCYKDDTFAEWDMRGCNNIDIVAELPQSAYSESLNEQIVAFGTYGTGDNNEFANRTLPTCHNNVRLTPIVRGTTRINTFIHCHYPDEQDSLSTNVILKNIELCDADLSMSKNVLGINLRRGYAEIAMRNCTSSGSVPNLSINGNASDFSADITCDNSDINLLTATVPTKATMLNSICSPNSASAGNLKIYSYPIRIKNGNLYSCNQFVGATANRPSPDREIVGSMYFDDTIKKPLWYIDYWRDGTHPGDWIEADRSRAGVSRIGTFADRPVSSASDASGIPNIQPGFRYLCTDGYGEIIFKEKSGSTDVWLDANGNKAGVAKAGLITNRPLTTDITVGFIYINTLAFDISTVEYPIGAYCYIGSDTWISPDGKSVADGTMPARV